MVWESNAEVSIRQAMPPVGVQMAGVVCRLERDGWIVEGGDEVVGPLPVYVVTIGLRFVVLVELRGRIRERHGWIYFSEGEARAVAAP